MYRDYWGLRSSPFAEGLNARSFFQSPIHEEALARLHFLVEEHQRVGLLLGPSGCGKSLLLAVLARQLLRKGHDVAIVNLVAADAREVLWQVAAGLGLSPDVEAESFEIWRMVQNRFAENRYRDFSTVLLFDDAEEASPEVISQIVRLIQAECSPVVRVSVVLTSQGTNLGRLGPRLLDLADLQINVEAWDATDTADYLTVAVAQAGRTSPLFTGDAMQRLYELTDGIPRRVKQLAQLALLAGAGNRVQRIDATLVDSVHSELGVVTV